MSASLQALREAYPQAQIDVAVSAAWAPALSREPMIRKIWTYERHNERGSRAKALALLALKLRREKYDCVVNFHASPSSATLAFATGARTRSIHFHGHKDKNRYSTVLVPGKGVLKPIIERDLDAIRALGVEIPSGRLPEIHLEARETQQAQRELEAHGLTRPVLALGLGSSRPTKCWPLERFAEVAIQWRQKTQGSVIAFLGPGEESISEAFLTTLSAQAHSLGLELGAKSAWAQARIGLPLRQMAALLSQCSVLVGNDSGPKHLAVALSVPTVTLFGPEHPFEWHPYPVDLHPYFFMEGLACRRDADPGFPAWCGLHLCVEEKHRCMRETQAAQVSAEAERIMRK